MAITKSHRSNKLNKILVTDNLIDMQNLAYFLFISICTY